MKILNVLRSQYKTVNKIQNIALQWNIKNMNLVDFVFILNH